jgi:hypothetical protein
MDVVRLAFQFPPTWEVLWSHCYRVNEEVEVVYLASLQSRVVDAKYCVRSLDIVLRGQRLPTRYIHKSCNQH